MCILIVAGSLTLRRIVASMLQQLGYYDLTSVDSFNEIANQKNFDLIIADHATAKLPSVKPLRYLFMLDAEETEPSNALSLKKPFSAEMLAVKIKLILEQPA